MNTAPTGQSLPFLGKLVRVFCWRVRVDSAGEVIAIDSSRRFIDTARLLQSNGSITYDARLEGDVSESHVARKPTDACSDRIQFEVGDALDLRPDLGDFDLVLAANLLDRVPDPSRLLGGFGRLVRQGGQLVLTSPYTWLEEYTPRHAWLPRDGHRTSERLAGLLPGFTLARRQDLPFVLREHARKFQWSVAEATTWRRI